MRESKRDWSKVTSSPDHRFVRTPMAVVVSSPLAAFASRSSRLSAVSWIGVTWNSCSRYAMIGSSAKDRSQAGKPSHRHGVKQEAPKLKGNTDESHRNRSDDQMHPGAMNRFDNVTQ